MNKQLPLPDTMGYRRAGTGFSGRGFAAFLVLVFSAWCLPAFAQSWPSKPIRLVLSQPAGSSPDIVARLLAERLGKLWGQQVIVDNRPGGQNTIGAGIAARAAPDGYTFFYATTAPVVINRYTFKSLPYDPEKDFVPVAMMGKSGFVLAVNNDVPAKSLAELIALAKAQPDKLAFANEGPKTFSGLIGQMFNATAGVKILQVPHVRAADAITETIAGRTTVTLAATAAAMRFINQGSLRPLAVTGATRAKGLENVPPIAETFPGFEYEGWHAVFAPTGTPKEALQRFNQDLDRVLKDPDVVERLASLGVTTEGAGTPESLVLFLNSEHTRWSKLVRDIGLIPE